MSDLAVNWTQVLQDMQERHFTINTIADKVKLHRDTLYLYSYKTTRPKHAEGERLLLLWMQVTGKTRDNVPKEELYPSAARLAR